MKKHFSFSLLLLSIIFGVFLFGCEQFNNLEVPKSVSVKTGAEFNASLGQTSFDSSKVFDVNSLREKMQESIGSNATIYDYKKTANDTILSYLVHFPLYEVPLDFSSYLDNLDEELISGNVPLNFSQSIVLPNVNLDQTIPIEIPDISNIVTESMNNTLALGNSNWTIPELGMDSSVTNYLKDNSGNVYNSIVINGDLDAKIWYTSGSAVKINVTKTDTNAVSSDFEFNLKATIVNMSDVEICSDSKNVANGGVLVLDIGGKELPNQLKIKLDAGVKGGESPKTHNYNIAMTLADNTKLDKVTNLNATQSDLGISPIVINQEANLSDMVGYFTSAVIGEGSLLVQANNPVGWTNVTCGFEPSSPLKLNGSGFVDVTVPNISGTYLINNYLNLNGKTLSPTVDNHSLTVNGTIGFEFNNASIVFVNGSSAQTINVAVKCGIKKLSNATIDFSTDKYSSVPTSFSLPTDGSENSVELPSELLKFIRKIDFGSVDGKKHNSDGTISGDCAGFGIKCKVTNTFNANIPISFNSTMFDFTVSDNLSANSTSTPINWTQNNQVNLPAYEEGVSKYIDFSCTIPSTLTLTNLVLGDTYTIGISDVELVADWDYISFVGTDETVSDNVDLSSLNLSSMFDSLDLPEDELKKIKLSELPMYFYAQKPNAEGSSLSSFFDDIGFSGKINLKYNSKNASNVIVPHNTYIVGTELASENIDFVNQINWPEENVMIQPSVDMFDKIEDASFSYNDFNDVLNDYPSDMNIGFSIGMQNTETKNIYQTSINELLNDNSSVNIKIDLAMILSLKVDLTDQISLDIMSIANPDWKTDLTQDLLGRKSATEFGDQEELQDVIDAIEYITITYSIRNSLLNDLYIALDVDDNFTSPVNAFENPFILSGTQNGIIKFTDRDINKLLEEDNYPFHPDVKLIIGEPKTSDPYNQSISIKRSNTETNSFDIGVQVSVKMKEDSPISVWGEDR